MRKFIIMLVVFISSYCYADLSLGNIQVTSKIGQPLNAIIPLSTDTPVANITVQISSNEDYKKNQIATTVDLYKIFIRLIDNNGKPYIKVYSNQIIKDDSINLFLTYAERGSAGRKYKNFSIMLDPIQYDDNSSKASVVASTPQSTSSPSTTAMVKPKAPKNTSANNTDNSASVKAVTTKVGKTSTQTKSKKSQNINRNTPSKNMKIVASGSTLTSNSLSTYVTESDTLMSVANLVKIKNNLSTFSIEQIIIALAIVNQDTLTSSGCNINLKNGLLLRIPPATSISKVAVDVANKILNNNGASLDMSIELLTKASSDLGYTNQPNLAELSKCLNISSKTIESKPVATDVQSGEDETSLFTSIIMYLEEYLYVLLAIFLLIIIVVYYRYNKKQKYTNKTSWLRSLFKTKNTKPLYTTEEQYNSVDKIDIASIDANMLMIQNNDVAVNSVDNYREIDHDLINILQKILEQDNNRNDIKIALIKTFAENHLTDKLNSMVESFNKTATNDEQALDEYNKLVAQYPNIPNLHAARKTSMQDTITRVEMNEARLNTSELDKNRILDFDFNYNNVEEHSATADVVSLLDPSEITHEVSIYDEKLELINLHIATGNKHEAKSLLKDLLGSPDLPDDIRAKVRDLFNSL